MQYEIRSRGIERAELGAKLLDDGVHFAVFSEHAERIDVCLFDEADREFQRLALPERIGHVWQGFVPHLRPGARYGLRAHGPMDPSQGHRFNSHKLLLDPYATIISGPVTHDASLMASNNRNSEAFMPKAVVPDAGETFDWGDDAPPARPFSQSVVYEAHVKGLTKQHPSIAAEIQGTYDALAHPAMLEHYAALGIKAIELLPIHAFIDDAFLLKRGLRNYWGYNTLSFFAPELRYVGPGGVNGLKQAIKTLHAHGIEVILDVVYNHTAEGGAKGLHLSLKGLDNRSYYRADRADLSVYVNDTGCGNTLNTEHPFVMRMVLDSLRHWVEDFHVDGFRFDLAPVLGREAHGFDCNSGFLRALMQDPVLSKVKLIAEPWDIGPGGYQLGAFPAGFAEWNDRFRDDVRKFWRKDKGSAAGFAGRLAGSADVFDHDGRQTWASINFVTAHDGFTLMDVVRYAKKHNQDNHEGNRDGHNGNYSANFGVEGPTDDADIRVARDRRRRNLFASLLLAQGTPMVLAGDELGQTQRGNNNGYCQDNDLTWLDWASADKAFLSFAQHVIALRAAQPNLRQPIFLHGEPRPQDGLQDILWMAFEGEELDWDNPSFNRFAVHIRRAAAAQPIRNEPDDLVLAINAGSHAASLRLPASTGKAQWSLLLNTAVTLQKHPVSLKSSLTDIAADSVCVFAAQQVGQR
ncbi:MAG: glycogen debranching protein GlgX [Pseudomonadota bacterium]